MCATRFAFLPAIVLMSLASTNASAASIKFVLEAAGPVPDDPITALITPPEADFTVAPSIGGQTSTIDMIVGRNVLITSVDGTVPDTTRTASDVDRITFDAY